MLIEYTSCLLLFSASRSMSFKSHAFSFPFLSLLTDRVIFSMHPCVYISCLSSCAVHSSRSRMCLQAPSLILMCCFQLRIRLDPPMWWLMEFLLEARWSPCFLKLRIELWGWLQTPVNYSKKHTYPFIQLVLLLEKRGDLSLILEDRRWNVA